jgi:hypothetical protein
MAMRFTSAAMQITQARVRGAGLAPRKSQSALCMVANRSRRSLRAQQSLQRDTAHLDIQQ